MTAVSRHGRLTCRDLLFYGMFAVVCMLRMCVMVRSSYMVDPTLNCSTHNCFSWDYEELNESSGWWSFWYPACNSTATTTSEHAGLVDALSGVFIASNDTPSQQWQSPINITTAAVVNATQEAVLGAWNSTPFTYEYMLASKQDAFNYVRCSLLNRQIMITLQWNVPDSVGTVTSPSLYRLIAINVRYPAEHVMDGVRPDAEVQFTLFKLSSGTIQLPGTGAVVNDTLETFVSVNVLLRAAEVEQDVIDPVMKLALNKIAKGLDTGSTRFQMPIPDISSAYTYVGSLSYPPCTAGMRYFIAADVRAMDVTTLQLIRGLYKNNHQYRAAQPLNGRVVQRVNFSVENMLPRFRTSPSPLMYRLNIQYPTFKQNIWKYSSLFWICICVFFALVIIWLLIERHMYIFPYSLTWREPVMGREIYGVPTRYSSETGDARPMTVKQWEKSLLNKNEVMRESTELTRLRKVQ